MSAARRTPLEQNSIPALDSNTINRLYRKLADSLPDARSELVYRNHFELLISVILSAQATDKSVNAVTRELFHKHPTPEALLELPEPDLARLLRPIGLAPTKAKNVLATCRLLLERHNGRVPEERNDLEALPGVGRKTANVVLNEGFGKPTIAVDTHVFRVANRTGLAPGKTPLETETRLLKMTPRRWLQHAHRYLILHGRYVCKAKAFDCSLCAISAECRYEDKTR